MRPDPQRNPGELGTHRGSKITDDQTCNRKKETQPFWGKAGLSQQIDYRQIHVLR